MASELPTPKVIDGSFLLVPVKREVQQVIDKWMRDNYEDLRERIRAIPGFLDGDDLMIQVPQYQRYVTKEELS